MIEIARSILELERRVQENPLSYFRPTPPQEAFLRDPSPIKLLLGGNQVGKTAANCAEILYRCLGVHPYLQVEPPPVECWLITHSHDQSRTIQDKLYRMIPAGALHEDCVFIPGRGFRGQVPIVRFKNGSIVRIKTVAQGLGLASASIPFVAVDEPIPESAWGEIAARVLRGGAGGKTGTISITMTPVGCDVQYLRAMVEDGRISCTRAPLTVEDTTPRGCEPLLSQDQIDHIASTYLPIDRDARISGSFDVGIDPSQLVFDNFKPTMISSAPCPPGDYKFAVGIDHGSQPGTQVAILSAIDMKEPQEPRIYILGEYIGGASSPEVHVRGILELLKRYQVDPAMCTWTGDGAHYAQRGNRGFKMSNGLLMRAFERVLNLPPRGLPFTIRTALKFKNSVYYSASMIYSILSREHFWIRPECRQLISSLQRWTLKRTSSAKSTDPYGHAIDGLRYCVLPVIHERFTPPAKIRMY
jgi:hypothetical protein